MTNLYCPECGEMVGRTGQSFVEVHDLPLAAVERLTDGHSRPGKDGALLLDWPVLANDTDYVCAFCTMLLTRKEVLDLEEAVALKLRGIDYL